MRYNVRVDNEQCVCRQRQIDCLQANLAMTADIGRSPRVRKRELPNAHCGQENRRKSMTNQEMLSHVDHTQLKPYAKWEDIVKLCDEAVKYGTASVCVPPAYIKRIHDAYNDQVNICTVVGFPLGYSVTKAKVAEVEQALADGANEIDMVVNISDVKNHEYAKVEEEIKTLKKACGEHILKVIIETCFLTEEEKIAMCEAVTNAGADFIKTSTGFGTGGATLEDVRLFKKHIGPNVRIKAAGGVKTREDLEAFLQEGCERIGTSSAVGILNGEAAKGY